MGLELVEQVHRIVVGDFKPVLTFVLDIDPSVSLQRAAQRGGSEDRFEQKGLRYQQKVREGFLQLAAASPATHALIDGGREIKEVQAEITDVLYQRLGLRV